MKSGISVCDIRQSNRALLLQSLYFGGPASRKGLAGQTGLTAASVTQLTAQLLGEGVLIETEKRPPKNRTGRAEQLLDIDRKNLFAAGASICDDCIRLTLTDMELSIISSSSVPHKSGYLDSDALASEIKKLTADRENSVVGIGIGVRGSVDPTRGISMDSYGLLPRELDLITPLAALTGLPVSADNNVRGMLTARSLLHPHSADGVSLLVKYGPGVGGALMVGGQHFLGSRFTACEIGHMCACDGGKPCICGRRGCLETLLRYDELRREAAKLFSKAETPVLYSLCSGNAESITAKSIYFAFSQGDAGIQRMLREPLEAFAVAIASCCAMYDPDSILLCSEMFQFKPFSDYLKGEIERRLGHFTTKLHFLSNQDELGEKSAAATAVKAFLSVGASDFKQSV